MHSDTETFVTVQRLAQQLGLPESWLRGEAKAGRIPTLRAGRQLHFNPEAVERTLLERAEAEAEGGER